MNDSNSRRIETLTKEVQSSRDDGAYALRIARTAAEEAANRDEVIHGLQSDMDRQYQNRDRHTSLLIAENKRLERELERTEHEARRMERDLAERREASGYTVNFQPLDRPIVDPSNLIPFNLGGKIPTIRAVRILCGLGLKEAKDVVDGWTDIFPKPVEDNPFLADDGEEHL